MTSTLARRLPAYGRSIRDALDAGMRPAFGDTVAVCVDWPVRCALAHVVCIPTERDADGYDFTFLAGIDTIVWFREQDRPYAEDVHAQLVAAGSPIVARLCVPEELE